MILVEPIFDDLPSRLFHATCAEWSCGPIRMSRQARCWRRRAARRAGPGSTMPLHRDGQSRQRNCGSINSTGIAPAAATRRSQRERRSNSKPPMPSGRPKSAKPCAKIGQTGGSAQKNRNGDRRPWVEFWRLPRPPLSAPVSGRCRSAGRVRRSNAPTRFLNSLTWLKPAMHRGRFKNDELARRRFSTGGNICPQLS